MEFHHLSRIVSLFPNMAVSRFACYKIRKELLAQGLANDEEIVYSLLICRHCSQKLEPGVNCQVKIEGKSKKFQNSVSYFCELCKKKTRFGGVRKGTKTQDKKQVKIAGEDKEKEKKRVDEIYEVKQMRSLSKEGQKKSLLDSFFESTQEKSLYKIFL